MKPWHPTHLTKENVPQPPSKKHSRSSSDESFNPLAYSPGDEEEIEVEQVVRPKPQPKKKKQQKNEVSPESRAESLDPRQGLKILLQKF